MINPVLGIIHIPLLAEFNTDLFLGDLRHPQTVHWSTYKRGAKPFRHPAAFSRPGTGEPDHWICPQIHWLIVILPIQTAQMGVIAHFQTHAYCYIILYYIMLCYIILYYIIV